LQKWADAKENYARVARKFQSDRLRQLISLYSHPDVKKLVEYHKYVPAMLYSAMSSPAAMPVLARNRLQNLINELQTLAGFGWRF